MPGEQLSKMIDAALKEQRGGQNQDREPFPPVWKPNIGDVLEALIIKSIEVKNKFGGGTRNVRIVIDREGNQMALPGGTVLVRELLRSKASPGDFVYVKYEGEKAPKTQPTDGTFKNPTKIYTVVVIPKDAFERTGEKFPAPKPVPKPAAPQVPQASAQSNASGGATQAPPVATPPPASGSVDKNIKRLAGAVGAMMSTGGMKVPQFENLYRQIVGDETKKASDAALDFPDLFTVAVGADGTERVQRVQ